MRIIAGKNRGLRLASPSGQAIRPSSDRLRQALFNILEHGNHGIKLHGARVVDVFAGTGALGLEALSRGARQAIFIENNPIALEILQQNIVLCGEGERSRIICADATCPPTSQSASNLVLLDPPYGNGLAGPALSALSRNGWLNHSAICIVELASTEPFAFPPKFEVIDERKYGVSRTIILRFRNATENELQEAT